MGNFLINVIGIFLLIMIGFWIFLKLNPGYVDRMLEKRAREARQAVTKRDEDLVGKRMIVPREGSNGVRVNLYRPHGISREKYPAVFLAHGGSFLDGDADQMDSFCERMADRWECVIISINYTKIDVKQVPYQQEEIRDTVLYFGMHSSEFHVDPHQFAFLGFSAGAHLMVGAAAYLKQQNFPLCGMISVYPVIDDSMILFADNRLHISPFTLITTDSDPMADRYPVYLQHLENAGVEVNHRNFPDAEYGFLEYNNPEFMSVKQYENSPAVSDEQADLARACEIWMGSELDRFFTGK